jgi:hypothetical protein
VGEHLQAVWRSTGKRPPELDVPELPPGTSEVWAAFCRLDNTRTSNGFGVDAITEARLVAWQQLHRVQLTPWEIECIQMLDILSMNDHAEQQQAKNKR